MPPHVGRSCVTMGAMTVDTSAAYQFTVGGALAPLATPADLPGLNGWLAAEDASNVTWFDRAQSGNAVRASGTTGSLSVNAVNGYSAVVFNANLWMRWPDQPGDVTYFLVLRPNTQTVEQVVLDGDSSVRRYLATLPNGGAYTAYTGTGGTTIVGGSSAGQGWQVVTLAGGAGAFLAVDGQVVAAAPGGDTTGLTTLRLGTNNYDGGSRRWRGSIAEIVRYGRAMTPIEVASVHGYLARKFGLTVAGAA